MIYTTLFLIGFIGLVAMGLLGLGHGGVHGGHIGHGNGHGHAGHGGGKETRSSNPLWSLVSPFTLISLCLGAGATGLILQERHWPSTPTAIAASIGAVAFYALIVRPLFAFAYKFVSQPSKALEGSVAKTAVAASKFDGSGRGVVKLNVDGQLVRVLAELEQDDRLTFDLIQPGDQLTITAIDGRRNTCRVARM